jgi:hypothetical protein
MVGKTLGRVFTRVRHFWNTSAILGSKVFPFAFQAVIHDPSWLLNRGIWAISMKSVSARIVNMISGYLLSLFSVIVVGGDIFIGQSLNQHREINSIMGMTKIDISSITTISDCNRT